MPSSGPGIATFVAISVIFLLAVIGALAWGYGRLSAKKRLK